jgi:hypothetical protein
MLAKAREIEEARRIEEARKAEVEAKRRQVCTVMNILCCGKVRAADFFCIYDYLRRHFIHHSNQMPTKCSSLVLMSQKIFFDIR